MAVSQPIKLSSARRVRAFVFSGQCSMAGISVLIVWLFVHVSWEQDSGR